MILEFEDGSYRLFDIRNILTDLKGLIEELHYNQELFLTATLDSVSGIIRWDNGVEFDPQMLFVKSINLENLTNIREFTRTKNDTPVTEAIILLKDGILVCKELIDNYEYLLEDDFADNDEKNDAVKEVYKLKKELLSYQQGVLILEEKQKKIEDINI
jgi:hypothetical protein